MPRDVTRLDFEGVFTREDNPNQVREFNYVFSFSMIDTESGKFIMENEFTTIASDTQLTLDEMKAQLTERLESGARS